MGDVAHMQHQIGLDHLLQRGAEGGDEHGRQIGDEAHRVGQDDAPAARQPELAHGRIERLEHLVLGGHGRAGQAVEERRLAGVGVADDGHDRQRDALAPRPMQRARAHHAGELPTDGVDAVLDQAAVGFDLRLAGAAEEAVTAALPFQVRPRAHQSALLIGEVRQLDLQASLARAARARRRSPGSGRCGRAPCSSRPSRGCAAASARAHDRRRRVPASCSAICAAISWTLPEPSSVAGLGARRDTISAARTSRSMALASPTASCSRSSTECVAGSAAAVPLPLTLRDARSARRRSTSTMARVGMRRRSTGPRRSDLGGACSCEMASPVGVRPDRSP